MKQKVRDWNFNQFSLREGDCEIFFTSSLASRWKVNPHLHPNVDLVHWFDGINSRAHHWAMLNVQAHLLIRIKIALSEYNWGEPTLVSWIALLAAGRNSCVSKVINFCTTWQPASVNLQSPYLKQLSIGKFPGCLSLASQRQTLTLTQCFSCESLAPWD